jgi:hypothetical protein
VLLYYPVWIDAVQPGDAALEALQSLRKRGLVISLAWLLARCAPF